MVRKVLEEALELLEMQGWTKGAYARNAVNQIRVATDRDAVTFCARGAVYRACYDLNAPSVLGDALGILQDAVGKPVVTWNDAPETTFSEVREVFKRAVGGLAVSEDVPVAA